MDVWRRAMIAEVRLWGRTIGAGSLEADGDVAVCQMGIVVCSDTSLSRMAYSTLLQACSQAVGPGSERQRRIPIPAWGKAPGIDSIIP